MKKVYLQYWEESERNVGVHPDGCSLHFTLEERNKYVKNIYKGRKNKKVPDVYEKIAGEAILVYANEKILNESTRLMKHELNNLLKFNQIIL
jgi:hypothetical protein